MRHSSMRCLTEWAQARRPLHSQNPNWPEPPVPGRNMRNPARGSDSCFRLQRHFSSELRVSIVNRGHGYQHTTRVPRVELRKRDCVRRLDVSARISQLHGVQLLAAHDFAGGSRTHRHGLGSSDSRRLGWCLGRTRSRTTDWLRGIDANTEWTRLVDEEVCIEICVAFGAQPGIPRR